MSVLSIVNLVILIYMIVILADLVLDRIEPSRRTVPWVLQKTTHALTEPVLKVIGLVTPKMQHGTVDWRGVFAIVVLFVIFQVLRLAF